MITAIALALVVAGGLALYAWWGATLVAGGVSVGWVLAGLPIAFFAVPLVFAVLWFTLAWFFRAPRPRDHHIGFKGFLRMFALEIIAIAGSAPRMIAYGLLMRDPPPAPADLPVLLLHGVLCNAGVWEAFRRYLRQRGIGPVYALSYGPPLGSIDDFADQTALKIDAILAATGARQVVIVGHSMGGLVARAYLRRFGGAKVRRLITIATPHQGSRHAYMMMGTSLAQLRPGNPWLKALVQHRAADEPPIVSLWSRHDSMVTPQTSSVLERAENVALIGIGHNALLRDRAVFARVAEEIERAKRDQPPLPDTKDSAEEHMASG